jgi:hypothetical protein
LLFADFEVTADLEKYKNHQGPKFSYGPKPIEDGLHFMASGLLEQKGIKEQNITIGSFQDLITLFAHKQSAALPYDPFSAIFYMISRYEEYLPHMLDSYDRFTATESLAKKNDFLHIAVVDRWADQLKSVIKQRFPALNFQKRQYKYIPTLDIDNAYAYKEKGVIRSAASLVKNLIAFDLKTSFQQIKVLAGREKDPFDTYNYQLNIQKKYHLKPIYFILLGDYGFNDKSLSHENRSHQSLIKSIADYATVGIHPSYASNTDKDKLKEEIIRLERIVKREVIRSRQHFLKLSLPETYRNLMEEDIEEDYTMGFASELGFRAGTCTPYYFYDLDEEAECKLKVFPFQVMEATLKYYLKSNIEESITQIKTMIDEVKEINGTFISLWHNESLSDEKEWKGWREVYEKMTAYAAKSVNQ